MTKRPPSHPLSHPLSHPQPLRQPHQRPFSLGQAALCHNQTLPAVTTSLSWVKTMVRIPLPLQASMLSIEDPAPATNGVGTVCLSLTRQSNYPFFFWRVGRETISGEWEGFEKELVRMYHNKDHLITPSAKKNVLIFDRQAIIVQLRRLLCPT